MSFLYFWQIFFYLSSQQIVSSQLLTSNIHSIRSIRPIYLYKEKEFKGARVSIDITHCSNIPSTHAGRVYSINTANQCARLYNTPNCSSSGKYIEVLPRSPCHNNLEKWNFGGLTLSSGPCPDKCSPEIIGNLSKTDVVTVQIFDRIDYKGAYRDITVNGCTPIPNRFFHDLLSIKTNNQCIQLYNTPTCKITGSKVDTIELRRGTPFHHDIKYNWPFPTAKAISTCKFKCDRLTDLNGDDNENNLLEDKLPKYGEIFLYHARYFEGTYLKISGYHSDSCVNITDDWEGLVESVRVGGNGTCVQLFDRRDCKRGSLILHESKADLAEDKFDGRTRSIKWCSGAEIENSLASVVKEQRIAGEDDGGGAGGKLGSSSSHVGIVVVILIGIGVVVVGAVVVGVRANKIGYGSGGGIWQGIRENFGRRREGWSGFRNGGGEGVDGAMGDNEGDDGDNDMFAGGNRQGARNSGNGFDLLA